MSISPDLTEKLKDLDSRITEMLGILGDKKTLTQLERHELKQRLTTLKFDLRMEAKCSSSIANICNEAASALRFATNTHPINSNWAGGLTSARYDIREAIRRSLGS